MDESDRLELGALVIGFLQQSLKDNPNGFSLQQFERTFPDKCDEPYDWYKRYKKDSTIEALRCIPDVVKISCQFGTTFVSLNTRCDKVDNDLVDLITNQKPSGKRKAGRGRPTARAYQSFSLNKQYNFRKPAPHNTRLNFRQQHRDEGDFIKKDSLPAQPFRPPSIYRNAYNARMAHNDPRGRGMVPPQIRTQHRPSSSSGPTSQPNSTKHQQPAPSAIYVPRPKTPSKTEPKRDKEDPDILQKKIKLDHVRQRIIFLLTKKFSEIKILHLNSLYQLEFEEKLDPVSLGHPNLTSLLRDPALSEFVQINLKSIITISLKSRVSTFGKENVGSVDSLIKIANPGSDEKSKTSSTRAKFEAIDSFNVKGMLQTLEPLRLRDENDIRETRREIDPQVMYKTMRIIFKSPNQTLKIDDWPIKFDQETRFQIKIREYGFRTLVDFFKHLATKLPIKVKLEKDDWVASADMPALSNWMNDCMLRGKYQAVTAIEASYELIAFPDEQYTFARVPQATNQEYVPAYVLATTKKKDFDLWIQLRTPKMIEEHLYVEASMTCYGQYKEKEILAVPQAFIKPGFPCAVYDITQQRWCRALIINAGGPVDKNREVSVLLVDYASQRQYKASELLCLMRNHLRIPVSPIYAKISGVEPKSYFHFKRIIQEYTSPPVTLACKFLKTFETGDPKFLPQTIHEVRLVDTRSGQDCDLADDINMMNEKCDDKQEDHGQPNSITTAHNLPNSVPIPRIETITIS